jgi:hypothetical protein
MTIENAMHLIYFIIIGVPFAVVALVTAYCWYMYAELKPHRIRRDDGYYGNAHPFRKR